MLCTNAGGGSLDFEVKCMAQGVDSVDRDLVSKGEESPMHIPADVDCACHSSTVVQKSIRT